MRGRRAERAGVGENLHLEQLLSAWPENSDFGSGAQVSLLYL